MAVDGALGWSAEDQTLVLCHVDKTESQWQTPGGPGIEDAQTVLALDSEEMSATGLEGHLDRSTSVLQPAGEGRGRAHCCLSYVTELLKGRGGARGLDWAVMPLSVLWFPSCSLCPGCA